LQGSDPLLQREVLSLLDHDGGDAPTTDGSSIAATPYSAPTVHHALETPGRIGPYTIVGRLGRGGSGLVLLAEQHEPVRRRVAIKLVPHAAISPEFAARFDFERRALERTEHPYIARILDTGRTADGLPYLVLEYVEGATITEYCRQNGLKFRERIGLVLDVADAVQHAHQRGVIHRDLKPGNILVAQVSGRATPRVLDFGIAKPIADSFEGETPPTSGMPLGTPAYMAPEQTGGQPVDTRADVYALGAVLYELACGKPPIEIKGDPLESLRRIRETVPAPVSKARSQNAAAVGDEPVPAWMLTDLDCILSRSLEKEPARRYATVSAFADDLRRLLRREPIAARPATLAYRAARFAQRNRVLVAAAVVVILTIAIGTTGMALSLVEAQRQRREAQNQTQAQREINRFLTDDLLAASSPDQQGQNVTALDLLHRAGKKVDERFADRPLIAAAIHHTLGTAYMELGAFEDADHHIQRALTLRQSASGENASDTIRTEIAAASLLARLQRLPEAEASLSLVINRARRFLGPNDPALYSALNDLGVTYETLDKGKDAERVLTEALEGRTRLLGPRDPLVLVTSSNLAQAYERIGDVDRSLQLQIKCLKIAESLPEPPRMTILGLCNNIGATYQDLHKNDEAAPYLRRAAELASQYLGNESPDTLTIQGNLAGLEADLGDPERGAKLYQDIVEIRTRLQGPDAFDTLVARYGYWNSVWKAKRLADSSAGFTALLGDIARVLGQEHWLTAQTRVSLARSLLDEGKAAEALPLAESAAAQFLKLYGAEHARTATAQDLVKSINQKLAASRN
jgi:tetratricopeptide (TPR) repeat protein